MHKIPKAQQAAGLLASVFLSVACFTGAHYAQDQTPVLPPLAPPAKIDANQMHKAALSADLLFSAAPRPLAAPVAPTVPKLPAMPPDLFPAFSDTPALPALSMNAAKEEIILKGILPPSAAVIEIGGHTQAVRLGQETRAGKVAQITQTSVTIGGRTFYFRKGDTP